MVVVVVVVLAMKAAVVVRPSAGIRLSMRAVYEGESKGGREGGGSGDQ